MCADYKGSNARVVESSQNEDDISTDDEIDNESNIKTETVIHTLIRDFNSNLNANANVLVFFFYGF